MATNDIRTQDRDSLARFLGWFSIGLGTAQLLLPKALSRVVGAEGKGKAPHVMRLLGVRELAHGTAILTRPRPTFGVWASSGLAAGSGRAASRAMSSTRDVDMSIGNQARV